RAAAFRPASRRRNSKRRGSGTTQGRGPRGACCTRVRWQPRAAAGGRRRDGDGRRAVADLRLEVCAKPYRRLASQSEVEAPRPRRRRPPRRDPGRARLSRTVLVDSEGLSVTGLTKAGEYRGTLVGDPGSAIERVDLLVRIRDNPVFMLL